MTRVRAVSAHGRRLAVSLIVVAALFTACTQENATVVTESNATIPLEVQPRSPQDPTPTAPPAAIETPAAEDEPEADSIDSIDSITNSDAAEPDRTATDAASETEISARGQALGCADATSLRRWIGSATPSVAAAGQAMADQVWLCPDNDAVSAELTCYASETNAVLAALSELDEETAGIAQQIAASGTTFCASGDVVRLGINDLVDRLQDS